ncbi:helix-turn-helix transcriptional regulator [Nonomuraea jabiensis]|uniref:Transcriptional regulator with XRE-family HTH domain n=1 Tax=Nonomuraea jabiensis TaxID=882448 RepID=A0A7W9GDM9_9ACTN|nr:helix-turn-helix transcriptional regulator [Nonomuraea jabiensis]MBB5781877.1 transcriptional regulator with XRE-family HTH domain [Nonomuraea jabiensis]
MKLDRARLADFLRRSRERLQPQDAGLTAGPRRRTPGLRREEVAQLAGVSADYVMRLEQARSSQPSVQLLTALARALRLTEDETAHLYLLAGHRPPEGARAGNHVRPGLLYLLDRLGDTPAQLLTDLGDLLAQNPLAEALFGCVCTIEEPDRNIVWRWFTDPFVREAYPVEEHDRLSRLHVADLRAAATRRGYDHSSSTLIARLETASEEFAALWPRHEVAVRRESRLRVMHPSVGPIEFDFEMLQTQAADQRLRLFTPPPGSKSIEALELLRVVGPETVHRSHR